MQVQAEAMPTPEAPPKTNKRSRSERRAAQGAPARGPPPARVAYNMFMKMEMKRLYKEQPGWHHSDVFRKAASGWAASPMNPKNAPPLPDGPGTSSGAGPSDVGAASSSESVDAAAHTDAAAGAMDAAAEDGESEEDVVEVEGEADDGQPSSWQWLSRLARWR